MYSKKAKRVLEKPDRLENHKRDLIQIFYLQLIRFESIRKLLFLKIKHYMIMNKMIF